MKTFYIVFVFLVLAISTNLLALDVYPVQRVVFPNGMTLVAKVDKRSDLVAVHTFVGSGWSNDDKNKSGLANLTISCLAQGSKSLHSKKLYKRLGDLACFLESGCKREVSFLETQVLSESLVGVLKLHADLMLNPLFSQTELDEFKIAAQKKLKSSHRHPSAEGYLADQFRELLYGSKHPYSRNRLGNAKTLRAITVDDLKDYHKKHFQVNAMTVSIVGNFEFNDVVKQLMKLYSAAKVGRKRRDRLQVPSNPPLPVKSVEEFRPVKGLTERHVCLGFQGPSITSNDFFALALLKTILVDGNSSILAKKFADKPYVEDLSVHLPKCLGVSDFTILFRAKGGPVDATVAVILQELEKLKRIPISLKRLERNRLMLKNEHAFQSSSRRVQSYLLGAFEVLDEYEFSESYFEGIDSVRPKDIMRVANKYFGLDKFRLLVFHPEGESNNTDSKVTTRVLPNGLRVIVKPEAGDNTIGVSIGLASGAYIDPPGKEGLSAILFKILDQGSTIKRPNGGLNHHLEHIGAVMHNYLKQDAAMLAGHTTTYFVDEFLDLALELYKEPNLVNEEFKKAKREILDKLESMDENLAANLPNMLVEKLLPDNILGRNILGTKESISSITLNDVRAFHRKYFVPGNTTVVLVGNITPEKVFDLVESGFGKLDPGKVALPAIPEYSVNTTPSISYLKKSGSTDRFVFGFAVPRAFDYFASLSVIGNLCGWGRDSELYKILTNRGFVISNLSLNINFKGTMAILNITGELNGGDMKILPKVIKGLATCISNRTFTADEIKHTSRKLATALAIQHENKLGQAVNIFWSHLYAPDPLYIHGLQDLYKNVSSKDVEAVAKKYFKGYQLIIAEKNSD